MSEHINGHNGKPLSMMIKPQFDRDPLRRKTHQVVNSQGFIVHKSEESIEMLRLNTEKQHAVFAPNDKVAIIDESGTVVHQVGSYYVEPQDGPPNEERRKLRDKWLDNVMRFLLPPKLYARKDNADDHPLLARWFRRKKIQIEMRPDGGAVRIWRDGSVLSSWGC